MTYGVLDDGRTSTVILDVGYSTFVDDFYAAAFARATLPLHAHLVPVPALCLH